MPTNRVPLRRGKRNPLHPEAVVLYRRGRELLAQGLGGSVEFKEIASTLDLGDMLDRAPHMVSLFGDLSGEPPLY